MMRGKIFFILFLFLLVNISALSSTGTFTIEGSCNDGLIENTEECDSTNISLSTCNSLGYDFGVLSCTGNCTFDESRCYFNSNDGSSRSTSVRECNDRIDNDNDGLMDLEDSGCTNRLDNSEFQEECTPNWQEESWGNCVNNLRERVIIDINHCSSNYVKLEQGGCFSLFLDENNSLNLVNSGFIILAFFIFFILIILKKFHKRKRHRFK